MNYDSDVSKLVANVPSDLKGFVTSESDKQNVSISSYITQLIVEAQKNAERKKAVRMIENFTKNKIDSKESSVELVRKVRNGTITD